MFFKYGWGLIVKFKKDVEKMMRVLVVWLEGGFCFEGIILKKLVLVWKCGFC